MTIKKNEYSKLVADRICRNIAAGKKMSWLRKCDPDIIPNDTVMRRWLRNYPYFAENYRRARETWKQKKALADQAEKIKNDQLKPPVRATRYTKETAYKICDQVAQGKTLEEIALSNPSFPDVERVTRWLYDPEFKDRQEFRTMFDSAVARSGVFWRDRMIAKINEPLSDDDPKGIKRAQDISIYKWQYSLAVKGSGLDRQGTGEITEKPAKLDLRAIAENDTELEILNKYVMAQLSAEDDGEI